MRRYSFLFLGTLVFASVSSLCAQTAPENLPAAAQASFNQGTDYEARGQLGSALDSYKAAYKQSGQSVMCLQQIYQVQMKMDAYKDAAATADKIVQLAHEPQQKAAGELLEGKALYSEFFAYSAGEGAYDKNPKRATESLKPAQETLARAVSEDPGDEPLLLLYARVLAAQHQDDEAGREFAACASVPGTSAAECTRAIHLSSNIESGRNQPIPEFELKTISGDKVSRDSLAGKVVLVDFWATWCPACRQDSDYVQSLLDSFPDGRFVLLEVDVDENRKAWTDYVDQNRLKGTQTHDDDKRAQTVFHVSAFPTYIIFDGNGSIRLRAKGTEGDLRGTVRKLLAEQSTSSKLPTRPAE